MIRNIIIYLCLLTGTFLFSIFYYAWFSWFLFLTVVSIPIISVSYTHSDAADDLLCVDLGGRRIIKKKKKKKKKTKKQKIKRKNIKKI